MRLAGRYKKYTPGISVTRELFRQERVATADKKANEKTGMGELGKKGKQQRSSGILQKEQQARARAIPK